MNHPFKDLPDLYQTCESAMAMSEDNLNENQCDGCKQGLPIENGIHQLNNIPFMACTKNRYIRSALHWPEYLSRREIAEDRGEDFDRMNDEPKPRCRNLSDDRLDEE